MAYITVDLEQFDDEDIIDEYHARGLGDNDPNAKLVSIEDHETLTKVWIHDREGRKEQAYELMREYVYNKMNKIV
jgi:hypothetical protein